MKISFILSLALVSVLQLCDAAVARITLTRVGQLEVERPNLAHWNDDSVRQNPIQAQRPIFNIANSQYLANVSLGTPPQYFLLFVDTGSPSTWVAGTDCKNFACPPNRKYDASTSTTYIPDMTIFSSRSEWGLVQGHISLDCARVGDLIAEKQYFGEVDTISPPFQAASFDGALGLGFVQLSSNVKLPLLQNLVSHNLLDLPLFSLFLDSGNMTMDSELLLGGIDKKHFTGPLFKIPMRKNATQWELPLDALAFGHDAFIMGGLPVVFDSMTSYITMPSNMATYLLMLVGDPGRELCEKRENLPDLAFNIAGHNFNISAFDYTWEYKGACFPAITFNERRTDEPQHIVLGNPFLRKWYTVYNVEDLTVSLAESNSERYLL